MTLSFYSRWTLRPDSVNGHARAGEVEARLRARAAALDHAARRQHRRRAIGPEVQRAHLDAATHPQRVLQTRIDPECTHRRDNPISRTRGHRDHPTNGVHELRPFYGYAL